MCGYGGKLEGNTASGILSVEGVPRKRGCFVYKACAQFLRAKSLSGVFFKYLACVEVSAYEAV